MRRGSQFTFTKLKKIEAIGTQNHAQKAPHPLEHKNLTRDSGDEIKAIAELMSSEMLMRDRELLIGLT